jgi:hypothetical protein
MIYFLIGLYLVGQDGEMKGVLLKKHKSYASCEAERIQVQYRKDLSGAICVQIN